MPPLWIVRWIGLALFGGLPALAAQPTARARAADPIRPPAPLALTSVEIRTEGSIASDGTLTAEAKIDVRGGQAAAFRQLFTGLGPAGLQSFLSWQLRLTLPGSVVLAAKLPPTDSGHFAGRASVIVQFAIPGAVAFGDGVAALQPPWIGWDRESSDLLGEQAAFKTARPLGPFRLHETASLVLAPRFTGVCASTDTVQSERALESRPSIAFRGHRLICTRTIESIATGPSARRFPTPAPPDGAREFPTAAIVLLSVAGRPQIASGHPFPRAATTGDRGAGVSILEDRTVIRVVDDHDATCDRRMVVRILDSAGAHQMSVVRIPFRPTTEAVRSIRVELIGRDGRRRDVPATSPPTSDANPAGGPAADGGQKVVTVPVPGVRAGETIEIHFVKELRSAPFLAIFEPLDADAPIRLRTVTIEAPGEAAASVLPIGIDRSAVVADRLPGGLQVWRCAQKDIPGSGPPGPAAPAWMDHPGIAVLAGDRSRALARLGDALRSQARHGPVAQRLARQLTAASADLPDAVEAIRAYVAGRVRLTGDWSAAEAGALADPDKTLRTGRGSSADRAILLEAMLSAVGARPELVLATNQPAIGPVLTRGEALLPPEAFRAVLVRVPVLGCYLNDTGPEAHLGATAHEGDLGYVPATGRFQIIRPSDGEATQTSTSVDLRIRPDGSAFLRIEHAYYGLADARMKRFYAELPEQLRATYFRELASHTVAGAHPVGGLEINFGGYPGRDRFALAVPRFARRSGAYLFLELPDRCLLYPLLAAPPRRPFLLTQTLRKVFRTSIELPPGFDRLVLGPAQGRRSAPDGAGQIGVEIRRDGAGWIVRRTFDAEPALISPADAPKILQIESSLENRLARLCVFRYESGAPPQEEPGRGSPGSPP
jgi:transglutaminase-like putative cysteine protease